MDKQDKFKDSRPASVLLVPVVLTFGTVIFVVPRILVEVGKRSLRSHHFLVSLPKSNVVSTPAKDN